MRHLFPSPIFVLVGRGIAPGYSTTEYERIDMRYVSFTLPDEDMGEDIDANGGNFSFLDGDGIVAFMAWVTLHLDTLWTLFSPLHEGEPEHWVRHLFDIELKPLDRIASALRDAYNDHEIEVCVYSMHQCYGGPEEGGWYYTAYSLEDSIRLKCHDFTWPNAERDVAEAKARLALKWQDSGNDITSMVPGDRYAYITEVVRQGQEAGVTERRQEIPRYS